jgi:RNA-directed DNA polymerase
VSASAEQPALSLFPEMMMEAVVAKANMELAWKRVRANRGAPGPDGITLAEFLKWLTPRWPTFRQQLLDGTYRPEPVRRVTIDKPDGGKRQLGIPNVLDRLIQQAIWQVLTPVFDPGFSESSHGFRPRRSAHGVAKQVQQTIRRGNRFVVDMDRHGRIVVRFDLLQCLHRKRTSRGGQTVHDGRNSSTGSNTTS